MVRPKAYSFKIHNENEEHRKCKGIAKSIVKRQLKYEEYDRVLKTNEVIHKSSSSIRSKNHRIFCKNFWRRDIIQEFL